MKRRIPIFLATALVAALGIGTALSAPAGPFRGGPLSPPSAHELGLTGPAAAQWEALRAESIALRRVALSDLDRGSQELRALLARPDGDLRGFVERSRRDVDAYETEVRTLRDRQLALYESLPADDQARVREALSSRLARLEKFRDAFRRFAGASH